MANILDLSLLNYFNPLFVFLFVFVVVYAILEKTQLLGKNQKNMDGLISFVIALVFLFSAQSIQFVTGMIPGIVIIVVVIFFILLLISFVGIKSDDFIKVLGGKNASWWIIISVIVVLAIVASSIYGPQLAPSTTNSNSTGNNSSTIGVGTTNNIQGNQGFSQNLKNTLFNSKFLAVIFLLLLAAFTIKLLASPPTSK